MRTLFIVPLLVVLGCDPGEVKGTPAANAGEKATKKPVVAGTAEEPAKFANLSGCLESCEQAKASGANHATNDATCRLNCENAYGVQPTAPGTGVASADPIGDAATCMGSCYAHSGGVTDACVKGCKQTAAAAVNPPSSHALDHLTGCVAACENDRALKPTDRATCGLNCAQVARVDVPSPTVHGQAAATVPVQPPVTPP